MPISGKGPRLAQFDLLLGIIVLVLSTLGVVFILSATHDTAMASYAYRQVVWVGLGLVVMALAMLPDYRLLLAFHRWLYGGTLLLLGLVLVWGSEGGGAQSWFDLGPFRVQPSEFAKIFMVLVLARFLSVQANDDEERQEALPLWRLLTSLLYLSLPMLFIIKQPDLGTALTFIFLWFVMTFVAGARLPHLLGVFLVQVAVAAAAWHWGFIQDYQKARVLIIFDPFADPLEEGYHLVQSEVALAGGGATGMGLMQGAQTQLHFVPHQHNDAIFTVVGEEWGYVGCLVLLILYGTMLWQTSQIILRTPDQAGRLIAAGLTAVLGFHIFVNIGVVTGLVPFTGIPLPFLSYGGSNLLTNMIAIGLLQNIRLREEVYFFAPHDRSVAARIELATPPRL